MSMSAIATLPGAISARTSAVLTAIVVVPEPPLAAANATTRPGADGVVRGGVLDGSVPPGTGAGAPQHQRLDERFELALVHGLRDDIVRAGLEQAHALFDISAVGDGEDGWVAAAGLVVDAPAQQRERLLVACVEHDQLLLIDACEARREVACHRYGQAAALKWSDDGIACLAVGGEQQNAVGQCSEPPALGTEIGPTLAVGAVRPTSPNGTRPE